MRIEFKMEGGVAFFPGLSRPAAIDSDQLPEDEAGELKRLVDAVRFFDLPDVVGKPSPGAADYRQYSITAEEGGRRHTVRLTDPIEDANLQALVNRLRRLAR